MVAGGVVGFDADVKGSSRLTSRLAHAALVVLLAQPAPAFASTDGGPGMMLFPPMQVSALNFPAPGTSAALSSGMVLFPPVQVDQKPVSLT
ncbi:unnamed protein product, partial [Polarella glacialis]